MQQNPVHEDRIRAAYRVRAAAAGLCVGASSFALGACVALPKCLNSAWIASLSVFPASALACVLSRRLLARRFPARAVCASLALVLAAFALLGYGALVALARETLLPLARVSFVAQASAAFLLLCCLSAQAGALRLCFALRYLLPALLLLLCGAAVSRRGMSGLFPLLGTGAQEIGMAALCMLPAALPALLLALPPPELDALDETTYGTTLPDAGFLIRRVLPGALAASALLAVPAMRTTYEGIASLRTWGERMAILASGAPRESVFGTLVTVLQLLALALHTVVMLLCAVQAARAAMKKGAGR